eukprot:GEMP01118454.1.p1 GENE.GEMP01118454.1~~GEMP01118454.1.p1  ORF type:complete len:106 (+),score=27.24 GEMP01118454.1:145-462(+)
MTDWAPEDSRLPSVFNLAQGAAKKVDPYIDSAAVSIAHKIITCAVKALGFINAWLKAVEDAVEPQTVPPQGAEPSGVSGFPFDYPRAFEDQVQFVLDTAATHRWR